MRSKKKRRSTESLRHSTPILFAGRNVSTLPGPHLGPSPRLYLQCRDFCKLPYRDDHDMFLPIHSEVLAQGLDDPQFQRNECINAVHQAHEIMYDIQIEGASAWRSKMNN